MDRFPPPPGYTAVRPLAFTGWTDVHQVERGGQRFVCKRLGSRARGDMQAVEGLFSEGRLLEALGRATSVRAVGWPVVPAFLEAGADSAGPFLVMEALPMRGIHSLVRPQEALVHALSALAALHDADDPRGPLHVVHGDVSPANLLLVDSANHVAFVDFGCAQWRDARGIPRGAFRGTLLYAAPEVVRGEPFDARADLFALAASFLHACSGVPPRDAPSPAAMLLSAGTESIEPWATKAAAGMGDISPLLLRCVAFDAARRPSNAKDALRALRRNG